jgi:dihydrofolate reductase
MGRIVVTEYISIDGVIEAPGGVEDYEHVNWALEFERGEEGQKFKEDETFGSAALLLGRITYEGFALAWPMMEGEFADKFNSMPKYVISKSLTDPQWNNTTVLRGDVRDEVEALKQRVDGNGKRARMPLREARTVGDGITILMYGPIP